MLTPMEFLILNLLSEDDYGVWEVWGEVRGATHGAVTLEQTQDVVAGLVKKELVRVYRRQVINDVPVDPDEAVLEESEWRGRRDWYQPRRSSIHFYLSSTEEGMRQYREYAAPLVKQGWNGYGKTIPGLG
jgi:hypothetical protein